MQYLQLANLLITPSPWPWRVGGIACFYLVALMGLCWGVWSPSLCPLIPAFFCLHSRPATTAQAAVCGAGVPAPPLTQQRGTAWGSVFEWILNEFIFKGPLEVRTFKQYSCVVTVFFYFTCYLTSFFRLGCPVGNSLCFPTPRVPDQCRRLKTCSECLARHPKTFSSTGQVTEMCLKAVL